MIFPGLLEPFSYTQRRRPILNSKSLQKGCRTHVAATLEQLGVTMVENFKMRNLATSSTS